MKLKLYYILILFASLAVLSGCNKRDKEYAIDNQKYIDHKLRLSRNDYRDLAPPTNMERYKRMGEKDHGQMAADNSAQPNQQSAHTHNNNFAEPNLGLSPAPIMIAPRPPSSELENKIVSLTVTDDVPLRDVLVELALLANMDLELQPSIKGGIIFRAEKKPLIEVIERICDIAGLRYHIKGDVLRVEKDTPYIANYKLDFLNIDRSSNSNVNINTNVLSAGEGGGSGGINTGSNSSITASSSSDLWAALEAGVQEILKTKNKFAHIEEAMDNFAPASGSESGAETSGESASNNEQDDSDGFMVINRQAGLLTVAATKAQHEQISDYINRISQTATAQVLIEAKIVEVSLDEDYRAGIDWSLLLGQSTNLGFSFDTINATGDLFTGNLSRRWGGGDFGLDAAVKMLDIFGVSRTLSSPRLHAINNQQAVLTFAENQVFFNVNVERETQDLGGGLSDELLTVDSEAQTIPIGIILTILPSVNLDTNEVTLSVRPTLSRVTGSVEDPAVAFLASQDPNLSITNEVPVVEVRELDSILKVRNGSIMVIGGLMEEKMASTDTGTPVVSEIPFFGNLFKRSEKENDLVEMVIFIKATIIPNSGSPIGQADRRLYQNYTSDPRPLMF